MGSSEPEEDTPGRTGSETVTKQDVASCRTLSQAPDEYILKTDDCRSGSCMPAEEQPKLE